MLCDQYARVLKHIGDISNQWWSFKNDFYEEEKNHEIFELMSNFIYDLPLKIDNF